MIVGNSIILRAWSEHDLPALQALRNDFPLQQQLMTRPKANSIEQVKEWLANKTKPADSLFFIIACKQSDQVCGYVQVVGIDDVTSSGKLGICMVPGDQGKGYGTEAITLLEGYLRTVWRLRKLVLEVLADNERALHLYVKLGFLEVGRLRQHFFINNDYCDTVIMEKFLHL